MGKIKSNRIGSPWNREAAKPQKPGWARSFELDQIVTSWSTGKVKTNRIGSPWNREVAQPQKPRWGPAFFSLNKFQPAEAWAEKKPIELEAPGTARRQSHKNLDGAWFFLGLTNFQPAGAWVRQNRIELEAPGAARRQSHKNPDGPGLLRNNFWKQNSETAEACAMADFPLQGEALFRARGSKIKGHALPAAAKNTFFDANKIPPAARSVFYQILYTR